MRPVIILFAKAPVPGRVKTRLLPALTPSQACSLHSALVWDTLDRLQTLKHCAVELHTDISTDVWASTGVTQALQTGADLGLKMLQALKHALESGYDRAMIVGSDSPTVPLAYLDALLTSEADAALGPTEDGGYYAISCRRTDPDMFAGVEWSTSSVLQQNIQAFRRCGLSAAIGSAWFDVDEPEDLKRLASSHDLGSHVHAWLSVNDVEHLE